MNIWYVVLIQVCSLPLKQFFRLKAQSRSSQLPNQENTANSIGIPVSSNQQWSSSWAWVRRVTHSQATQLALAGGPRALAGLVGYYTYLLLILCLWYLFIHLVMTTAWNSASYTHLVLMILIFSLGCDNHLKYLQYAWLECLLTHSLSTK